MFKEFGIKSRMLMLGLLPVALLAIVLGTIVLGVFTPASSQQRYLIFSLALFALALGSLFAWRLGRSLETQIGQLGQAIVRLQNGQQDSAAKRLPSRELNRLAGNIQQLGKVLHSQREIVQQRLAQTQEASRQYQQTAEVQRIELDMARKDTRAASHSRNDFLANMSHEIRTPLNAILGFSQLLQKTVLSPQQHDHLHTIRHSAENLLGMLDQALDASGPETGSRHQDSRPFDLRELIHDCLSVVALAAHQKQLELVAMVYRDTPQRLRGDPAQLKQILIYLLGNAVRFTARGSIVLRTMLEAENSEFATLRISVQDTGTGLAADELQQVFQGLTHTDNSTAPMSMGMAIARRLTESMGGEIGVENTPGAGTESWICISLAKTATLPEATPAALTGQRIAIFETHELARQSLQHQLTDLGLEVLPFGDMHSLLQTVAEQQHDGQPIRLAVLGIQDCDLASTQLDLPLRALQQYNCRSLLLCPSYGQERLRTAIPADSCQLQSKPACGHRLAQALEALLDPRPAVHELPRRTALPDERTTPNVLCVDDNPANLLLVQTLLIGMGARVTAVNSGLAALQATEAGDFDLILMDIRMPGMDGLQASAAIRQREQQQQRRAVPIIALTAHVLPKQKRSLLQAGMNDLISKPISEEQLAGLLHKWSDRNLQRPGAPQASPSTDSLAILDHQEALRLAGGKSELASDLLAMLLGSLDEEQQAITRARTGNNTGELADRVHRLLGATRYCGVPELRTACQHCENMLRRGDTGVGQALDQLDLAINRLRRKSAVHTACHDTPED